MVKSDAILLKDQLIANRNVQDATFLQRFFKTGLGEYGEGDLFLGLRVPLVRSLVNQYYKKITVPEIEELLDSKWHEVRLAALITMTKQMPKADNKLQKELYNLYLSQIGKGINNWDLVDVTCPHVVGAYLHNKERDDLFKLAKGCLWQKRVSIISTFYFLRNGDIKDTLQLAELLVDERHDLLQKAVGWALREMGKLDDTLLYAFLDRHAATMPRTMLRYSLEKLSPATKSHYMLLAKNI